MSSGTFPLVRSRLAAMLAGFATVTVLCAQPSLVSVSPPDGATDHDVTQPVVFTFSEEMYPILPLALPGYSAFLEWTGLGSVPVEYAWDDSSTILTCTFPQNLPGTTQLGWTLNPPGVLEFYQLMSFEWFEPVPTRSGSFTSGAGEAPCDPDGIPGSYGSVVLQKYAAYTQTGPAAPSPSPEVPAAFAVFVRSPADDPVAAASLQRPGGSPEAMGSILGMYSISEDYPSDADLDAAHPGGSYGIEVTQFVAGASTASLNLPAGYPPIPQIANHAAAQAVDPAGDFLLSWNVFTDAGAEDTIRLEVHDALFQTVFEAPDVCSEIDLANSDTSIAIPAGTFQADRTYSATLTFSRVFHQSTETLQGFGVFGSVLRSTDFTLKTTGGTTVTPPGISGPSFPAAGPFAFVATDLEGGMTYAVEISPSAAAGSWTELSAFTAAGAQTPVTDLTADRVGTRFYRVVRR